MKTLLLNSGLGSRMGVLTSKYSKCMRGHLHKLIYHDNLMVNVLIFIEQKVIHKIETMLRFRTRTAEIRGSNERLAIAGHGFSQGWRLGKGIDYLKWIIWI